MVSLTASLIIELVVHGSLTIRLRSLTSTTSLECEPTIKNFVLSCMHTCKCTSWRHTGVEHQVAQILSRPIHFRPAYATSMISRPIGELLRQAFGFETPCADTQAQNILALNFDIGTRIPCAEQSLLVNKADPAIRFGNRCGRERRLGWDSHGQRSALTFSEEDHIDMGCSTLRGLAWPHFASSQLFDLLFLPTFSKHLSFVSLQRLREKIGIRDNHASIVTDASSILCSDLALWYTRTVARLEI